MSEVSAVEARAARAVPAAEVVERGGWLLRATPASPRKRTNSALPLPGAAHDLDAVEAFYRERGLTPIVQVSPREAHAALDTALAARGWRALSPTDVLVADAAAVAMRADARPARGVAIALAEDDGDTAAAGARLDAGRRVRATATLAGAPVGSGVVVLDGGWSGLFELGTAPAARRRGIARALVGALARWSAAAGADRLYLQVEAANAPAQALYQALGFERSHGYHYRAALI